MRLAVEAVLFDLDGVLVDSTKVVERHWRAFCEDHGLSADHVLPSVHGRRTIDNIRSLAPHLDAAAAAIEFEELEVDDVEGVQVLPGALEILGALPSSRWAVVTSGSRAVASARLRAAGLPLPSVLATADDVVYGKPEPDGYLAAATSLGRAPTDCLVVEDTSAGLAAGKAAGAKTLALLTTQVPIQLREADYTVPDLRSCAVVSAPSVGPVVFELSEARDAS
jgi:mannitol-1-/sugar-/sorbitol-6-phosphatase